MVGIGGRSKACAVCYRRRIKCDEGVPSCMRCIRRGITCPGYKVNCFISFETGQNGLQRLHTAEAEPQSNMTHEASPVASLPLGDPCVISWPVDGLCIAYARAHLPRNWCHPAQWDTGSISITNVADNLVQHILISLARTLFAYRFNQQALLKEGLELYGRALLAAQHALGQHNLLRRSETLEAVLALRAFDSFVPCNPGAWIQHSLGIERLLLIRGPQAHREPKARELLERARPLVVMACLRRRKGTILSDDDWKDIPWSDADVVKSPIEALIDIFVDLPTALFGSARSSHEKLWNTRGDAAQSRVLPLIRRLKPWYLKLINEHSQPRFDLGFDFGDESRSESSMSSTESFDNQTLTALALHAAVCLITLGSAFGHELSSMNCHSCLQRRSPPTNRHKHPTSESGMNRTTPDVWEMYHTALADACWLLDSHSPQTDTSTTSTHQQQPVEILIYLRHVWLTTRRFTCPLALAFGARMEHVLAQRSPGLPLSLYR